MAQKNLGIVSEVFLLLQVRPTSVNSRPAILALCHSELVEESLCLRWAIGQRNLFFARLCEKPNSFGHRDAHAHFQHCFHPCPMFAAAGDDLKRDMSQIPLLFVSMLELCWAIAMPRTKHAPTSLKVGIFCSTCNESSTPPRPKSRENGPG